MAFPWPHRNHWNSVGFIKMLNSWTNHKFKNALNSVGLLTCGSIRFPWPQRNHCFYCLKSTKTCLKTMDVGRDGYPESETFLQNRPSHWTDIAPLICRVVRAVRVRGRWAWIPGWGTPASLPFSPQTSDFGRSGGISKGVHQKVGCLKKP